MTSCVAHEYCIELHKKYLEMVNFTASLPEYKVTLVIPQKKTNKYYSDNSNILIISPKVNVVRIYKTMVEDGKGTVERRGNRMTLCKRHKLNENAVFEQIPDKVDLFVYFSIFMNVKVIYPRIKDLLTSGITYCNYLTSIQQLNQVMIPVILNRRDNCRIVNIINDFYEPILGEKFPHKCSTLSYYDTSDNILSAKILDAECKLMDCPNKDLDFIFAFTTMAPYRRYLSDYINTHIIENDKVKFFERNKFDESRDKPINQTEYYGLLERTKFSLLAPATKEGRFSWFRLLEALMRKNIPLMLEDCNYQDAIEFMQSDLYDIYKKYNLFVSYDDIINDKLVTLDYDTIWKEIEQSDFIKNVTNKENNQNLFIERCLQLA